MNDVIKSGVANSLPRIPSMDGMRFLMCLGIAMQHFLPYTITENEIAYQYIRNTSYFTDIFFIISGFFLARSRVDVEWNASTYSSYLGLRLARIYPLYLLCLLFFVIVGVAAFYGFVSPNNADRYDFSELPAHLMLVQSWGFADSMAFNYVTWSLSALFLMYLIFPWIITLARQHIRIFIFSAFLLLVLGEVLSQYFFMTNISRVQDSNLGILRCAPSFMLGVVLVFAKPLILPKRVLAISLGAIFVFMFIHIPVFQGLLRYVFVYSLIYLFLMADYAGMKTPLSWRVFTPLGKFSYGVYLIHPIVANVFFAFLFPSLMSVELVNYVGSSALKIIFVMCFGLSITVLIAWASYYVWEKPTYNFLTTNFRRKRPISALKVF